MKHCLTADFVLADQGHVDEYFTRMKSMAHNEKLAIRMRFMLREVIDLRRDGWTKRRHTATKAQVPRGRGPQGSASPPPRPPPPFLGQLHLMPQQPTQQQLVEMEMQMMQLGSSMHASPSSSPPPLPPPPFLHGQLHPMLQPTQQQMVEMERQMLQQQQQPRGRLAAETQQQWQLQMQMQHQWQLQMQQQQMQQGHASGAAPPFQCQPPLPPPPPPPVQPMPFMPPMPPVPPFGVRQQQLSVPVRDMHNMHFQQPPLPPLPPPPMPIMQMPPLPPPAPARKERGGGGLPSWMTKAERLAAFKERRASCTCAQRTQRTHAQHTDGRDGRTDVTCTHTPETHLTPDTHALFHLLHAEARSPHTLLSRLGCSLSPLRSGRRPRRLRRRRRRGRQRRGRRRRGRRR